MPDGSPSSAFYCPKPAGGTPLQRLVQSQLESLDAAVERVHGGTFPKFVRSALEAYGACGDVAKGFVRLACGGCKLERLVAFTCKSRVICASCGGRRMTDLAAHLEEDVVPHVPMRQWVLTVPFALRYRLSIDPQLVRTIRSALVAAIDAHLVERYAEAMGLVPRSAEHRFGFDECVGDAHADPQGVIPDDGAPPDAVRLRQALEARVGAVRTGTVTVTQRFGSGLNLHVHMHLLATDGTFSGAPDDLRFRDVGLFRAEDVGAVLRRLVETLRVTGLFEDAGSDEAPDPDALAPHDDLRLASVHHRIALGPRRGERVERLGARLAKGLASKPLSIDRARVKATLGGFDLEAATRVPSFDRRALERLCRYVLRPALGEQRLSFEGPHARLELKSPWPDGTTHLRFTPIELIEKLAALVPRPHENLLVYHGVFAGHAKHREAYVRFGRPDRGPPDPKPSHDCDGQPRRPIPARMRRDFATLMRRGLGLDIFACPHCGGRMRLVALVDHAGAAAKIAAHLGLVRTVTPAGEHGEPTREAPDRWVDYDAPPPPDEPA